MAKLKNTALGGMIPERVDGVSPDGNGAIPLGAVRFNAQQTLSSEQKAQARENIGAVSADHTHSEIVSDDTKVGVKVHDSGDATIYTGAKSGCLRVYQDFSGGSIPPNHPLTLEFSCTIEELYDNPSQKTFRLLYDGLEYNCTTGTESSGMYPISGGPDWVDSLNCISVQDEGGGVTIFVVVNTTNGMIFGNSGETYSEYEYHATEKTLATTDQIVPSDRIVSPDKSARVVVHNDGTASIDTDTVVMSVPSDFTFINVTMVESGDVVMKGPYPYTYSGDTVYAWIASDLDPSTFNPFTAQNDHLYLIGRTDSEPEFIAMSGSMPLAVYNIQSGSWTSGTPIISKAQTPSMYSGGDVTLSVGTSESIATEKYVDDQLSTKADVLHTHSSLVSPDGHVKAVVGNDGYVAVENDSATENADISDLRDALELPDSATFDDVRTALSLPMDATLSEARVAAGIVSTRNLAFADQIPSVSGLESASNKVTSLSAQSTDTQYPSAKCVYDIVGNINSVLDAINGEVI